MNNLCFDIKREKKKKFYLLLLSFLHDGIGDWDRIKENIWGEVFPLAVVSIKGFIQKLSTRNDTFKWYIIKKVISHNSQNSWNPKKVCICPDWTPQKILS